MVLNEGMNTVQYLSSTWCCRRRWVLLYIDPVLGLKEGMCIVHGAEEGMCKKHGAERGRGEEGMCSVYNRYMMPEGVDENYIS
jgi:hypothetical protein